MYEAFYKLRERPFLNLPDPDFLYWSETHQLAFTTLRYGLLSRTAISVVTGDIGAGKTTLVRQILRETPEDTTVGLVSNMQAGRGALLHWVMMALNQPIESESHVDLFRRFEDFVIESYANGRRVVLMFDEAQNLDVASLEELRMLSNINSDKDELLQIILVGQPQLRDLLARPELVQFTQRIGADFNLGPLTPAEIPSYVAHRLDVAGAQWKIFTDDAYPLIARATGGVPRLINTLCDISLVYGFASEMRVVDAALIQEFLRGAQKRGIYRQFRCIDDPLTLVRSAP